MIKKLSKYGNSYAILIDKPILDLLNISEGTNLRIKTDGNRLIIEPLRKGRDTGLVDEDEKLQKIYDSLVKKYGESFKRLAER